MENKDIFLSICIPSYNRPDELFRLLKSVDIDNDYEIEIVICEDKSPIRNQIRKKVNRFIEESLYDVRYYENDDNLGYDGNLRELIGKASGKWIVFMGDDDVFIPNAMNDFIQFLHGLDGEVGYVLRAYKNLYNNGNEELFDYFGENKFFNKGFDSYVCLFRKSVFISGFTFLREAALSLATDMFDGTLLYQLYVQAEICMNYSSAYFMKPITMSYFDEGTPYFGNSEKEKGLYTPGRSNLDSSINFVSSYFKITEYMDTKYGIASTDYVKRDMSKYSYPILSAQRFRGLKEFVKYSKELMKLGLNCTAFFYIYYIGLIVVGEKGCDMIIRNIKKILGKTPIF